MTREEAEKYAKNMTYREAIYNLKQAKSVPYRKATFIKVNELLNELEQKPNTWSLDDAREDFMYDVYNTLDFLPTNEEANCIIDIFDRVTSSIEQEPILDKIREEVESIEHYGTNDGNDFWLRTPDEIKKDVLAILDKYKAESE